MGAVGSVSSCRAGWEWRFFVPVPLDEGELPLAGQREDIYFPAGDGCDRLCHTTRLGFAGFKIYEVRPAGNHLDSCLWGSSTFLFWPGDGLGLKLRNLEAKNFSPGHIWQSLSFQRSKDTFYLRTPEATAARSPWRWKNVWISRPKVRSSGARAFIEARQSYGGFVVRINIGISLGYTTSIGM